MDVELPDGTVIRGVPDGMARADLVAKLKTNGYDTSTLEGPPSLGSRLAQGVGDLAAGAVRGAGSIGATLLAPVDAAARAVGIQNDFIGRTDRRDAMDAGLQSMGVDPTSIPFKAGKIGTEVAGTLGAGGAVANVAARLPGVAAAAPNLLQAIRSAGMSANGGGALVRAAGGAAAGAASAGLVDPDQALTGAAIGGVAPAAAQVAGVVGRGLARAVTGPAQTPELQAAIGAARSSGYVIPPTQANPTLLNRTLEGLSGKVTTAQNASAKNQGVTNELAAAALGLPKDTQITPGMLDSVRQTAGKAYDALGASGRVTPIVPGQAYSDALDKIALPFQKAALGFPGAKPSPVLDLVDSLRSTSFGADAAIAKIRELRSTANDAFKSGSSDVGRAAKGAANALEDAIETHLQGTGQTQLLEDYRNARQLIAKSYTVEKALNPETGAIDARKLGSQLKSGVPLTNELRDAAAFALRFPKASQTIEGMGSLPGTSPLDWHAGAATSMATGNPLGMLGVVARPGARALALSPAVQNRLIQSGQSNALMRLLAHPDLAQLGASAAPVSLTTRDR